MKFRTKVSLGLVALALMTTGVLLTLMFYQARASLMSQMRSTVLSVAGTTAAMIDVDRYQQIQVRADEDSPAYRDIEIYLRRIRNANRRSDLRVKFIYVIQKDPKNPTAVRYVVDGEEEGPDKSHFGESFKSIDAARLNFEAAEVQDAFVTDQWGTWMSAFAPIRDRNGASVGLVGADVSADDALGRRYPGRFWCGRT